MKYSLIYLAVVSFVSIVCTVADKVLAIKRKRRISEKALLCISALGGSFAMLITMILVRHKTKHINFMAGIPLIIVLQFIFTAFVLYFVLNMKA